MIPDHTFHPYPSLPPELLSPAAGRTPAAGSYQILEILVLFALRLLQIVLISIAMAALSEWPGLGARTGLYAMDRGI